MNDSAARNDTYGWARRNGLHEPYDFAIYNEELWGDPEALATAARAWERKHLQEHKRGLEDQMAELVRRIEIVEADLERNEAEDFGT